MNEEEYFAVYECGDAAPAALFSTEKAAQKYCDDLPRWCDREIEVVVISVPYHS